MKHVFLLASAAAALVSVPATAATTFKIDGAGSSISAGAVSGPCLGCSITASKTTYVTNNSTFDLNGTGASQQINFASLVFSGIGAGTAAVNATLAFSAPAGSSASASANAIFFTLAGFITAGTLNWQNATQSVTALDGTKYSVTFNDLTGIQFGKTVTQTATVRLIAAAVPEPATWAMMLTGFGMVAGAARYRRRRTTTAFA